jgi:hypothetical protein
VNYVSLAQYIIGAAIVLYGVALLAWNYVPRLAGLFGRSRERAPVDDLRLVIDLAARLRDKGKTQAVAVCQQLLDELLKPEGEK